LKKINKHNYEAFFLDYIEGNLSELQISDLNKFLSENPRLKDELDGFEEIKLQADNIEYKQKEKLIKQTQSQFFEITQFEYLAIAETENDISKKEKIELQNEINENSNKLDEYTLIKKTKLSPNNEIVFPYKNKLIKREKLFYLKPSYYAAAAVIALLLVLNQIYFKTDISNKCGNRPISLAKNNKKASHKTLTNNTKETNPKQEVINSHNQTNKQKSNKLLAFNDNEPHENINSYKEITIQIPEMKREALILNNPKSEIQQHRTNLILAQNKSQKKETIWQYAETGVNIWKKVSSSDFEMNNKYKKDGSIEKLNLYASNFKISKTFNK